MLDLLWSLLLIAGLLTSMLTGNIANANAALLDGAKDAISLCITMLGIMAFWTGLMEVAKEAGLTAALTRKLNGLLKLLFPDIPSSHPAREYISANILANLLGLGWAATPMGIKAMRELSSLSDQKHGGIHQTVASADMCTLLILNISSLQLIPINIIAYRSQYGSVNPTSIIVPALFATGCSTAAGILFAILARKKSKL